MTDGAGRFRFRFTPDSGSVYLVSARHHEIEYFSPPVVVAGGRADTAIAVIVSDTSSLAPVEIEARHLVITRPGADGSRDVFDLTVLRNGGHRTRIARDTIGASWGARLPAGTETLEVGQGDFSPAAVTRRGDSVLVFAPIAPGEKQLTIEYHMPRGRADIAFQVAESVPAVNLLIEEPAARVSGFPGAVVDTQALEGRTFRRWSGRLAAGDSIRVDFPRQHRLDRWILATLIGALVVTLAAAAWKYRVLAVVAVVVLAACRPATDREHGITIVDDAGDTTRLAAPARRVVSLVPATTELLFAIGAGNTVVGRTKWCDYPAAVAHVANVGDGINPNVEAVLAQRPDLVVLYRSAQHAAAVRRLRDLGIAAVQFNTDALHDVGRVGRALGRLTGHVQSADSVATVFDTALAAATASASAERPKVLLLVWEQPPMTVGAGSYLSELVERAGGTNLFADVSASSATVSIETVAARAPDLVLLTAEGPLAFATRPEWQAVQAVQRRRFVQVSGSKFSYPGPRSPTAITELRQRVHEALR